MNSLSKNTRRPIKLTAEIRARIESWIVAIESGLMNAYQANSQATALKAEIEPLETQIQEALKDDWKNAEKALALVAKRTQRELLTLAIERAETEEKSQTENLERLTGKSEYSESFGYSFRNPTWLPILNAALAEDAKSLQDELAIAARRIFPSEYEAQKAVGSNAELCGYTAFLRGERVIDHGTVVSNAESLVRVFKTVLSGFSPFISSL